MSADSQGGIRRPSSSSSFKVQQCSQFWGRRGNGRALHHTYSLWIRTLSLLLAYFIMPTGLSSTDIAHPLCHVPPQASWPRASASASAAEYEENDLLLAIFHQELGL